MSSVLGATTVAVQRSNRSPSSKNAHDPMPPQGTDFASRISAIQKRIANEPATAAHFNNLGSLYAEQGNGKDALTAYRRTIELDPSYARVHKNLSLLYRSILGDADGADAHWRRYRELSGD